MGMGGSSAMGGGNAGVQQMLSDLMKGMQGGGSSSMPAAMESAMGDIQGMMMRFGQAPSDQGAQALRQGASNRIDQLGTELCNDASGMGGAGGAGGSAGAMSGAGTQAGAAEKAMGDNDSSSGKSSGRSHGDAGGKSAGGAYAKSMGGSSSKAHGVSEAHC